MSVRDWGRIPRFRNCENVISIAAVEELTYRQSRLWRLGRQPYRLCRSWLAGQW